MASKKPSPPSGKSTLPNCYLDNNRLHKVVRNDTSINNLQCARVFFHGLRTHNNRCLYWILYYDNNSPPKEGSESEHSSDEEEEPPKPQIDATQAGLTRANLIRTLAHAERSRGDKPAAELSLKKALNIADSIEDPAAKMAQEVRNAALHAGGLFCIVRPYCTSCC